MSEQRPSQKPLEEQEHGNSEVLWPQIDTCEGLSISNLKPGVESQIGSWPPAREPAIYDRDGRLWETFGPGDKTNFQDVNFHPDTSQNLRAVIKAGSEVFGIVEVVDKEVVDKPSQTVVTRLSNNGDTEAELIGVVGRETGITVGRDIIPKGDKRMSREHFQVRFTKDGDLVVKDSFSKNGTQLVTGRSEISPIEIPESINNKKIGLSSLSKLVRRPKPSIQHVEVMAEQRHNPLDDRSNMAGRWFVDASNAQLAVGKLKHDGSQS